jgi:hypothetical protein
MNNLSASGLLHPRPSYTRHTACTWGTTALIVVHEHLELPTAGPSHSALTVVLNSVMSFLSCHDTTPIWR